MSSSDAEDLLKALKHSNEIVQNEEIIRELEQQMNSLVVDDIKESFKSLVFNDSEVRPAPLTNFVYNMMKGFEFTDRDFFWFIVGTTSGVLSCNFVC